MISENKNSSGIKVFDVEHTPTYGNISVEINFDFKNDFGYGPVSMDGCIQMMVDFWNGAEGRLNENEGDYLRTFLKQLCQRCLIVSIEYNRNVDGVIKQFVNEEGWMAMDGSCGIKLLSVELMYMDTQADYEIEERVPA